MCKLVAWANTGSSSGGKKGGSTPSGSLSTIYHASVLAPTPFSTSFFQQIIAREIGSCPDGGAPPSHSWVFVVLAPFSALAEQNRERKKKTKSHQNLLPSASSANPVSAKQLAGAAMAVLLCCFTRGKYMGA